MLFLTIVLLLAAVLDHSLGEDDDAEGDSESKGGREIRDEDEDNSDEDDEDEDEEEEITGSGVPPNAQKQIVDKHNEIRAKVKPTAANMLKMAWNDTAGENARKWAEQCILANSPEESRTLGGVVCGETIYQSNQLTLWKDVIDFWLTGKEFFKYGVGALDPRKNIFAYTQLIWYNSHIIGCGIAHCPEITFSFVSICHYCPGGNVMSKIAEPYKKGKPCQDCPKSCEKNLCTNPCKYTDTIPNCKEMREVHPCKKKIMRRGCKATCRCKREII